MADKKIKDLSEEMVRKITREEIKVYLHEITDLQKRQGEDIREIKEALLGGSNKYNKSKGLACMVKANNEYVERSNDLKLVDRSVPAIEFYEDWYKSGKWKKLEQIIENTIVSEKLKLFFNLGSWAGIISLITSLIVIIGWLKNLGVI